MAAWQFKMYLIPKSWVDKNPDSISLLHMVGENYDISGAWRGQTIDENLKVEIVKYFDRSKSWHADLVCFGPEEQTDIQIWYADKEIEDLQIRLDMRENFISHISSIVAISTALSCCIFVPSQHKIIEPESIEILRCAKSSNAYLYVNDPEAWIKAIKT